MKPLNRRQVKSLNALTFNPKETLQALWATRHEGSRGQVVKVTRNRVYFENRHDCTLWHEPIARFKAFHVLALTPWLSDSH